MHGGLFACVLPHRRCVLVLQLNPFNPFTLISPIHPLPLFPYACLTHIKGYKEEGMGFYCHVFWRCDFTAFSLVLLFCFPLFWRNWWLLKPYHATQEAYPFSTEPVLDQGICGPLPALPEPHLRTEQCYNCPQTNMVHHSLFSWF